MEKIKIYISVRHMDFWWGNYRLCNKTDWEDMDIYQKCNHGFEKIAYTCICTKPYFSSWIDDLKNDPEEKEFTKTVVEFLEGEQIHYHYCYDKLTDKDFYEVPFEAPRNESNIKPSYIETWHPSCGVDMEVLSDCAKIFCKKFLNLKVSSVAYKDIVTVEDALSSYLEENSEQIKGVAFTDSLIEQLEREWSVPKDRVLEILNRSVK